MGDLDWDDVGRWASSEAALLVYGALLAGLVGLGAQWWWHRLESRTHRDALFQLLSKQLWALPTEPAPYNPSAVQIRNLFMITAVGQILSNAQVLDAKEDAKLTSGLLIWQQMEVSFINLTNTTNEAQLMRTMPPEYRKDWHDHLGVIYASFIELRDDITKQLPTKYHPEGWMPGPDRFKTEGIWLSSQR